MTREQLDDAITAQELAARQADMAVDMLQRRLAGTVRPLAPGEHDHHLDMLLHYQRDAAAMAAAARRSMRLE